MRISLQDHRVISIARHLEIKITARFKYRHNDFTIGVVDFPGWKGDRWPDVIEPLQQVVQQNGLSRSPRELKYFPTEIWMQRSANVIFCLHERHSMHVDGLEQVAG